MNRKKLGLYLLGIALFCAAAIAAVYLLLPLTSSLKEAITAEIIGGGVLGGFISFFVFYIQETSEFQAGKQKAKSYIDGQLFIDIYEAGLRGVTAYNLGSGKEFYFDHSYINPLYDVMQRHITAITDYAAYYPEDEVIAACIKFYKAIRAGYVQGEALDNLLRHIVREAHYAEGIDTFNDGEAVQYLKGAVCMKVPETKLIKYLGWKSVPERIKKIAKEVDKNEEVKKLLGVVISIKTPLVDLASYLVKTAEAKGGYNLK